MTILEIHLTTILWILIGIWICYKSKWFTHETSPNMWICCTVIFMPFFLLISFIGVYIYSEWDVNN